MANHSTSATVSLLLAIIIIGIGQVLKFYYSFLQNDLASSKSGTLIAGGLGSLVFVFLLTAMSNFQMASAGEHVKSSLTEASVCLVVALIFSASIHRVAISVCLLSSMFLLSVLTGISQGRYATPVVQQPMQQKRKK